MRERPLVDLAAQQATLTLRYPVTHVATTPRRMSSRRLPELRGTIRRSLTTASLNVNNESVLTVGSMVATNNARRRRGRATSSFPLLPRVALTIHSTNRSSFPTLDTKANRATMVALTIHLADLTSVGIVCRNMVLATGSAPGSRRHLHNLTMLLKSTEVEVGLRVVLYRLLAT
jgi:hypothetical protein